MGLLIRALPTVAVVAACLSALPACYSPELADCAVACTAAEDCAPGQRCGADGWCAGDAKADRCDGSQAPDGGALPGSTLELRLTIAGRGQVELDAPMGTPPGPGDKPTCVSAQAGGVTCSYLFPANTWLTLRVRESGGWEFSGWDAPGCGLGRPKSCLVLVRTAEAPTFVTARFDDKD